MLFDHDSHFRQQVARERHAGLTRDYPLAQPHEANVNAERSPRVAWLSLRRLTLRRRHAPAYLR